MDLNEYIAKNTHAKTGDDVLERFGSSEIFFSLNPNGTLEGAIAYLEDRGNMGLFFTTMDDPRLADTFAGLTLLEAARMVLEVRELDGLLLQSSTDAWLCWPKSALQSTVNSQG